MNSFVVGVASVVVVIATILVMVAGRKEPDTEHSRTVARYVDSVNLLAVYVALFATYAVVAQLTRFIIDERRRFSSGPDLLDVAGNSFAGGASYISRGNDAIWRSAVQAALVLLAAALILWFHRVQRRRMVSVDGFETTSAWRVDTAYRYAACFVAAFVVLMALAFGLYGLFRVAAPGVAVPGGGATVRQKGFGQAISLLVLGLGALLIFRLHWAGSILKRTRPRPDGEPEPTPLATL